MARELRWQVIHGGDGFYSAIANVEPGSYIRKSQDGDIDRRDFAPGRALDPAGAKAGGNRITVPVAFAGGGSAHNHTTIVLAAGLSFKSTDRGDNWTRLGES